MAEFTFGIGSDDTQDALLQDEDFFDPESLEPGTVPELNTSTTIVNLSEPESIQKGYQDLKATYDQDAQAQASCEALLQRLDRLNGVSASLAMQAFDLGVSQEAMPSVFDYDSQLSRKHFQVTVEALSKRKLELETSMEGFIERTADGFKKAYMAIIRVINNIRKQITMYLAKNTQSEEKAAKYFNHTKKLYKQQAARTDAVDQAVAEALQTLHHTDAATRSLLKAQDESRRAMRALEDQIFEVAQARGLFKNRKEFQEFLDSDEML